jgi:hypothetical protein
MDQQTRANGEVNAGQIVHSLQQLRKREREQPSKVRPLDPESQMKWRRELRVPTRFPRTIRTELTEYLEKSWPPKVLMRAGSEYTEIVVRFPALPDNLQPNANKMTGSLGMRLSEFFLEVLSTVPRKGEDTLRAQLQKAGYVSFVQTWKHVLWLLAAHVSVGDEGDRRLLEEIQSWKPDLTRTAGRRKMDSAEHKRLTRRFGTLLRQCKDLHRAVKNVIGKENKRSARPNEVREAVSKTLWKRVCDMRSGPYILGGEIFDMIPYGVRPDLLPRWEDPDSWNPKHLATALLALERQQEYETIEKRLWAAARESRPPQT